MQRIEDFIKKRRDDIKNIEYAVFKTDQSWISILKFSEDLEFPRIHYFKLPPLIKGVLVTLESNQIEFWFTWKFGGKHHICKIIDDDDKINKIMTRVE